MLRLGIVGIGFMGMIHFLAAKKLRGAKVTAIATRDSKKRSGDWTSIRGNFGPAGQQEDLSGITTHSDAYALLADPEVDVVDVCLPNDRHAEVAIAALKAGKHVFCEKAIALDVASADRMLAAAREAGRVLMVGHVLPFFPEFQYALEAIRGGTFGKLLAAHFRRHISPPDWSADMRDAAKTGGALVDLHIHDTHCVCLAAGTPKRVDSRGVVRNGAVEFVDTSYLYGPGGPVISATSGSLSQPSRPFTHGFEIYLEKATLFYEAGGPLTVYRPDGKEEPSLGSGDPVDAFTTELQRAVDAFVRKESDPVLDGQLARDALRLCLKEEDSVRLDRPVDV